MSAAAMLLAMSAACGDDEPAEEGTGTANESTTEETTDGGEGGEESQGGYPPCSDVWIDGETLPEDYGGCDQEDGSIAGSSWQDCADGSRLYTHDSQFFTLADRTIVDAGGDILDDAGFEKRSRACS